MKYIDTHCHLGTDRFADDWNFVVDDCLKAEVGMLVVAADIRSSHKGVEIAATRSGVWAAVGVHPCDVLELDEEKWRSLRHLAENEKVRAIGETGLDFYWKNVPADIQKTWFKKHIELSLELGKALSIHARDSAPEMLDAIRPYFSDGLKAVWHCFTTSKRELAPALDFAVRHNLYLALGGLVTFEDQKALREYAKLVPDDLLLLETDAPYLIPRPKTTNRNDPRGVIRVAEVLAELRKTTPEHIADITTRNADRLFGLQKESQG
jgi:hydrolase, TatD family